MVGGDSSASAPSSWPPRAAPPRRSPSTTPASTPGPGTPRPTPTRPRSPKKVAGRLDEVARAHPGERVEVWFEDEARFSQKGTPRAVWARRGSRPTAVRQTLYDYLWVIAAACPATGAAAGIVMPHLDTPTISVFLEQFSAQLAPGVHAALISDGAGFHTSGELEVPTNGSLIRLPPYSPELNPIENLWHYLRAHDWSNRVHEDWEELKEAACSALVAVGTDAERIKSLCAAPYLDRHECAQIKSNSYERVIRACYAEWSRSLLVILLEW
ncbi:IS630 family transposase [Tundrisphaera lichenicola]|uniref:IS630 family transposase n=1 Tax=Tundrisphaera lichenicola TaxID=2029860 RepID=UPI003EB88068